MKIHQYVFLINLFLAKTINVHKAYKYIYIHTYYASHALELHVPSDVTTHMHKGEQTLKFLTFK